MTDHLKKLARAAIPPEPAVAPCKDDGLPGTKRGTSSSEAITIHHHITINITITISQNVLDKGLFAAAVCRNPNKLRAFLNGVCEFFIFFLRVFGGFFVGGYSGGGG